MKNKSSQDLIDELLLEAFNEYQKSDVYLKISFRNTIAFIINFAKNKEIKLKKHEK
jgi:hypothetical protein